MEGEGEGVDAPHPLKRIQDAREVENYHLSNSFNSAFRYYNIYPDNFTVNENGDCRAAMISSRDEGYPESNVSGFMNSNDPDYILSDNQTPPKKISGTLTGSDVLKQWHSKIKIGGGLLDNQNLRRSMSKV